MVELLLHLQRRRRREVRLLQLHVRALVLVRPPRHTAASPAAVRNNSQTLKIESQCTRCAPLPAHDGAERSPVSLEQRPHANAAVADPRVQAEQMAAQPKIQCAP
jgi:hypothetical protein